MPPLHILSKSGSGNNFKKENQLRTIFLQYIGSIYCL